jgi:hypothetical protein
MPCKCCGCVGVGSVRTIVQHCVDKGWGIVWFIGVDVYLSMCFLLVCVCIGRTDINTSPFVTDIVYVPPPLKRSFGCDKWLTYLYSARRKAEFEMRYVFDRPGVSVYIRGQ